MIDWNTELLLIDKPHRITSFDVIRRLRKYYTACYNGTRAPKMGHAGTLDPLATGLMVLGVGKGTKRLHELTKLDKTYEAEIRLGESRTTGDLEGDVVATKAVKSLAMSEVVSALTQLVGTREYTVSAYSAIKRDGVPMYKRARRAAAAGTTINETDLPKRAMTVYTAELINLTLGNDQAVATVTFKVGSGTYIRSLAEAVGKQLGYPACLQTLRRTQVGEYSVQHAYALPDIK